MSSWGKFGNNGLDAKVKVIVSYPVIDFDFVTGKGLIMSWQTPCLLCFPSLEQPAFWGGGSLYWWGCYGCCRYYYYYYLLFCIVDCLGLKIVNCLKEKVK